MESYEKCGQGRSYCSLCTLDTMHRHFFVTRLIINQINQVQWVDFKLENALVSLHSLKTMGLAVIFIPKVIRRGHEVNENHVAGSIYL
jgi:hypothetical protein